MTWVWIGTAALAAALVGYCCYTLGSTVGFILGFRKAASDVVITQLKEMEQTLGELGDPAHEQELVVVRLNKDETNEPIN